MNGEALVKKTTKIMFGDAGISGTAQYMSQLVWVLFLKVFDYKEEEWELEGDYTPVIPAPFRFRDWADPRRADGAKDYSNRITGDKLIDFVNNILFPYLRGVEVEYKGEKRLFASEDSKAAIVRSFMAESQNYMKDGVRLRQLINEIGDVDFDVASEKHDFNDFYERLLKELQNGGKATGEFYTPRAITRFIVDHVDPKIGETVADFACGTGGFLADSIAHLQRQARSVEDLQKIQESIYGIEWKQLPYMLCVTNMYLHNIDDPRIVHGDGLAKDVLDLSDNDLFKCIVMNPPFGGEFNKADLKNFPDDISSSESADLFVARIIYCLKKNGRCGLVLPDGLLFNNDQSKVNLKRLLMTECNLHTVIRLPGSVFAPYTSISTNLLFFDKTGKTEEVWFYRMDMPEGRKHFNKTHPITREDMRVVDEWWDDRHEIMDQKDDPSMTETWKSRKYTFKQIEDGGFNLDLCGFPHDEEIILSPEEIIANFKERRESLDERLDEKLSGLMSILHEEDGSRAELNGFSVIENQLVYLHAHFIDEMRKSVLQYAMQGKLITQDPGDEPASVLLDRIRDERVKLIKTRGLRAPKGGDSVIYRISDGSYYEKRGKGEPQSIEVPFEIPDSWEWARLGTLFEMQAGKNISAAKISDLQDDRHPYPCFGGNGIRGYVESPNRKGSYPIVGRQGALCGCINYAEGEFYATEHAVVTTCFDDTDVRWACMALEALNLNQYATSTAQPGLAVSKIVDVLIPVPPAAEQKRIMKKLNQILPHIDGRKEDE